MQVLSEFLQAGLAGGEASSTVSNVLMADFPLWQVESLVIPAKSNAYAYLNLFGPQVDDDSQILDDREDRVKIFAKHFKSPILAGIDAAKKEGGELGRASGLLVTTLDTVRNA